MWDPGQYLRFGDERGRPFFDLLARVAAVDPGYVVDLGCGPGNLTATLADRWPGAQVLGVDNSAEMIGRAEHGADEASGSGGTGHRLGFELADIRDWQPARQVDVFVSNAVLQWVPDHQHLLTSWAGLLGPGGWL